MGLQGKVLLLKQETAVPGTYVTIASQKVTGITIDNSVVEDNHKDIANGWSNVFPSGTIKTMGLNVTGTFGGDGDTTEEFEALALSADPSGNFQLEDGENKITGVFMITNYSRSGQFEGFQDYSATLVNVGAVTKAVLP